MQNKRIAAEIAQIAKSGSLNLTEQEEIRKELESHFYEKTKDLMLSSKEELVEELAIQSFGNASNLGKMFFAVNYPYLQVPVIGPILQIPMYRYVFVCLAITLTTNILVLPLYLTIFGLLPLIGQLVWVIYAIVNRLKVSEFILVNILAGLVIIFMAGVFSLLGFVSTYILVNFLFVVLSWGIINFILFSIIGIPKIIINFIIKKNGKQNKRN